jgi:hypothetical protein
MPAFVAPRFLGKESRLTAPHQNIALRNAIISSRVLAESK